MRLSCAVLMVPAILAAQPPQPAPVPGLVRGTLLECDTGAGAGELSLRSSTNEVFRFTFDGKTYFERDRNRIQAAGLRTGELVEVVADSGAGLRYARTVHVIEPPRPSRNPQSAARLRSYRSPIEHMAPMGNLTFSGILHKITAARVVLRLKDGADQTILLRQDTRFLEDGEIRALGNLRPQMRVFIRAGKDLYGEVEAFQIIHGRILQPESR